MKTLWFRALLCGLLVVLSGCGDSEGEGDDAGGVDAGDLDLSDSATADAADTSEEADTSVGDVSDADADADAEEADRSDDSDVVVDAEADQSDAPDLADVGDGADATDSGAADTADSTDLLADADVADAGDVADSAEVTDGAEEDTDAPDLHLDTATDSDLVLSDAGDSDSSGDVLDEPEPCPGVAIVGDRSVPPRGAVNVDPMTPIVVFFDPPAASANITVGVRPGDSVTGTQYLSADGTFAVFERELPWTEEVTFLVTVTADSPGSCERAEDTFTFTPGSDSLPDPSVLFERAYVLDQSSGVRLRPERLGLRMVLHPLRELLLVADIDASSVSMAGVPGSAGLQNTCRHNVDLPLASFSNPDFTLFSEDLALLLDRVEVTYPSLEVSGRFDPSGDHLTLTRVGGIIDIRTLSDGLCDLLGEGVCELCEDESPTCIEFELVGLSADATDESVVPISPSQTENHLCGNCENLDDDDGDDQTDTDDECDELSWP